MQKQILISLGKANPHAIVGRSGIRCEVVDYSDDSVKVRSNMVGRGGVMAAWVPRKALIEKRNGAYGLAKWYKPNEYTAKFLNLCADASIRN